MLAIYFFISFILVGLDQWVKYWTVSNLALGESQPFIPSLLSLTYIQNRGAAWSILEGQMLFFFVITIVAVAVVSYLLIKYRNEHWLFTIGLAFVLAGALGNFIDRMRLGYVIDMFQTEFMTFPIFNVADVTLFLGVVAIFSYTLFEEKLKGKKNEQRN
ncbi:signal peptidase II [Enterococcus sp. LJL98]